MVDDDMTEKIPNRKRSGLILLFVTCLVIVGVLTGDFVGRKKAHSYDLEDMIEKYYDDEGNITMESITFSNSMVFEETCSVSAIGGLLIGLFFIISMSILLKHRKTYGQQHSRKMAVAFFFSHMSLIIPLVLFFIIVVNDLSLWYVSFAGLVLIIFTVISVFLSTYELEGKKYGIIGLILGIGSVIPLLFLQLEFTDKSLLEDEAILSATKTDSFLMMITDLGLIIAMAFFLIAIWKAIKYVKDSS